MGILAATRAPLTIAIASAVIVAASAPAPLAQPRASGLAAPRIDVGPNILVSHDGNVTHIEPHVGAHPNDPKKLVGSAIVNYRVRIACRLVRLDRRRLLVDARGASVARCR